MTSPTPESIQQQFEKWHYSCFPSDSLAGAWGKNEWQYDSLVVRARWSGWKAAYTAGDRNGRERAAKVADKYTCGGCGVDDKCSREIRELPDV